jgi:hypothetical protein
MDLIRLLSIKEISTMLSIHVFDVEENSANESYKFRGKYSNKKVLFLLLLGIKIGITGTN